MKISVVSIFPEIFKSFLETSLIAKAIEKKRLICEIVNPRDFCEGKQKQIDDEIYGGGAGMLMKAKPVIDAVESIINSDESLGSPHQAMKHIKIIFLSPSEKFFDQRMAYEFSSLEHIIFICGRYEGIDYRFEEYMKKKYSEQFTKISLGRFVTMGGEVPAMLIIESVARLIPGVINEEQSHLLESYDPKKNMQNIEYPHYTRPEEMYGMKVPEVLLSGNHSQIAMWRIDNEKGRMKN